MGNQVTIKLDSRVFYVVIALVAVIGIFAIGWWLGTQLGDGDDVVSPAAGQPAAQSVSGAQPVGAAPVVDVGQPSISQGGAASAFDPAAQQAVGSAPVSAEEVPVQEGEPRLWIDGLADTNWTYDMGTIPANQASEADFTVTNVGNAELVIEEATASCGCTAALVEDSTVAPGESTKVRVSYDPRVNREAGKVVKKQVRIKSNDPLIPLAEFAVSADVAAE